MNSDHPSAIALNQAIVGKTIKTIQLFQINPATFDIKNSERQFVDGGIEIGFEDGSYFSFGWDEEYELFNIAFLPFENLFTTLDDALVDIEADQYWDQLIGNKIESLEVHWDQFEDDEAMERMVPRFLFLKFDENTQVLIAPLTYDMEEEGPANFEPDFCDELFFFFAKSDIEAVQPFIEEWKENE